MALPSISMRLKGLYAEPVQGRGPVEKHRVFLDYLFQHIPYLRPLFLHQLLGILDGGGKTLPYQPVVDKWLEELQGHVLGKTALVKSQLGANHDDGTARVVDPFAEQVLAETSLLAPQHVARAT